MNKTLLEMVGLLAAVVIVAVAISAKRPMVPSQDNSTSTTKIGGDRDAHGCLGPAGYSWCEVKQKCIRPWEEACAATSTENGVKLNEIFTKDGVTIQPTEVVEDSRCPVDVQCVWAGTVKVKVMLTLNDAKKQETLTLGTPVDFFGKQVTLSQVLPAKNSKVTITPADYQFIFTVTLPSAEGQHCGGFIQNAPTCPTGYHCKLNIIADTGGVCVKDAATSTK